MPQVVRADVYVAERYGGWQEVVLNSLADQFDEGKKDFKGELKDVQNTVVEAVKASGTAGAINDKALKGLVIPFAKLKIDEAKKGGKQVIICAKAHCSASARGACRGWPAFWLLPEEHPCNSGNWSAVQRLLDASCAVQIAHLCWNALYNRIIFVKRWWQCKC